MNTRQIVCLLTCLPACLQALWGCSTLREAIADSDASAGDESSSAARGAEAADGGTPLQGWETLDAAAAETNDGGAWNDDEGWEVPDAAAPTASDGGAWNDGEGREVPDATAAETNDGGAWNDGEGWEVPDATAAEINDGGAWNDGEGWAALDAAAVDGLSQPALMTRSAGCEQIEDAELCLGEGWMLTDREGLPDCDESGAYRICTFEAGACASHTVMMVQRCE